jgi:hypothetical protein
MRILLDHCVPKRLRRLLMGHLVLTTEAMGWKTYKNGRLLNLAEMQFDVFLTTDKSIPFQQNMDERSIALVIMSAKNNSVPTLASLIPQVLSLLPTVEPGQVYIVEAQEETDDVSQQDQEQDLE